MTDKKKTGRPIVTRYRDNSGIDLDSPMLSSSTVRDPSAGCHAGVTVTIHSPFDVWGLPDGCMFTHSAYPGEVISIHGREDRA